VNLSGLEQYQLAPDHHQDSSHSKVVRRIAKFYNGKRKTVRLSPYVPYKEQTFLSSRDHPTQDPDCIRVGNHTIEGDASGRM
jgi:hypothetical protein